MEEEAESEQAQEANRALRATLAQHELREIRAAARTVVGQVEEAPRGRPGRQWFPLERG